MQIKQSYFSRKVLKKRSYKGAAQAPDDWCCRSAKLAEWGNGEPQIQKQVGREPHRVGMVGRGAK